MIEWLAFGGWGSIAAVLLWRMVRMLIDWRWAMAGLYAVLICHLLRVVLDPVVRRTIIERQIVSVTLAVSYMIVAAGVAIAERRRVP